MRVLLLLLRCISGSFFVRIALAASDVIDNSIMVRTTRLHFTSERLERVRQNAVESAFILLFHDLPKKVLKQTSHETERKAPN